MLLSALVAEQDVQLVAAPWQAPHEAWHAVQVPLLSYWPAAQEEVQVPAPAENEAPEWQLRQLVLRPPSQAAQLSSQARQEPLLSYLPLGQLETHEPSSKSGVPVAGHVRHEKEPDEEHVSHEAWQERQWA